MKTTKQQIITGVSMCLLGGLGIIGFIVLLIQQLQRREMDHRIWFLLLSAALIIWAGIFYLRNAFREKTQKKSVLINGKDYWGKIKGYAYEKDESKRHQATGKYPLILIVRYLNENGDIREISVPTNKYEQTEFPITYNVPIKIYEGMAALTGAATDQKIQGEDELMLEGMDVKGDLPTVIAICPNCGGEVRIPVGKGSKCAYCGMMLRTDEHGRVIKTR